MISYHGLSTVTHTTKIRTSSHSHLTHAVPRHAPPDDRRPCSAPTASRRKRRAEPALLAHEVDVDEDGTHGHPRRTVPRCRCCLSWSRARILIFSRRPGAAAPAPDKYPAARVAPTNGTHAIRCRAVRPARLGKPSASREPRAHPADATCKHILLP